jgi:DNA invertase Pin-like site-specific DNA recombinase
MMKNKNNTTIRYAEYLRKSTDDKEKQVLSLSSQRDVLDRLKKTHELNVVETIEEKKSAKRPGRPGFNSLIKQIKAGKINGIVTWAPHRLSRNSVDNGELISLFDTGHLKEVVTETYVYRNTPMDIFMLGFHGLQAKFENDNKALDVKGGMLKSAKNGVFPGRPPLGYLPDKGGIKGARRREIDPIAFPIVSRMWKTLLAGTHTPTQIINLAINKWGLRNVAGQKPAQSTAYVIFHNTFYYGEFEWPKGSGNIHKGVHKPMITKAEFDRAQQMFRRPNNPRPARHYFSYGGCSLTCGKCGCAMTGELKVKRHKNGNVHQYTYYKCTKRKGKCSQQPITEAAITQDIQAILSSIQMPESIHDCLMDWVRNENELEQKNNTESLGNVYQLALEQVQKKISGLIDMRSAELITDDEFRGKRLDLNEEKHRLSQLLTERGGDSLIWLEAAEKLIDLAVYAQWRFKNSGPESRREILLELGSDLLVNERKLDLINSKWIFPLSEIAKEVNTLLYEFGPVLSLKNKGKVKSFLHSPFMCSQLKDVRISILKKSIKKGTEENVVIERLPKYYLNAED